MLDTDMQRIASTSQQKGFQVLAVDRWIARIPFSKIALVAAVLLSRSATSADVPVCPEQKKLIRDRAVHLKRENMVVAKTVASEQTTTCRREFSESLASALEKAKEQRRKLVLEIVESTNRGRRCRF